MVRLKILVCSFTVAKPIHIVIGGNRYFKSKRYRYMVPASRSSWATVLIGHNTIALQTIIFVEKD